MLNAAIRNFSFDKGYLELTAGWWGVLISAKVNDDPRHVPQKGNGYFGVDELKKGLYDVKGYDVVSETGPVSNNVTQSPNCLKTRV